MVKRILLHIGTHKTGTSALQRVFETERATLAAAGICYPSTDREPFAHLPKHSSLHAATRQPEKFAAEIALMCREAETAACNTLLISAEGFSEPASDRIHAFAGIRQDYEIHIYAYLRRQDQCLESLWNQFVKQGRETRSVAAFCAAPEVRARADYVRMLDFWSEIGTVHAADYAVARTAGIVAHFAKLANLPKLRDADFRNPSLGMNEALVLSWFNARSEKPGKRLLDAMEGDPQRYALGSTLRARLVAEFAPINVVLAERYGVTFSAEMPEEAAEPLTAADPAFLVHLLTSLSAGAPRGPGKRAAEPNLVKPEDLRVAANHLRRSRPDVALRLVHAGLALKPASVPLKKLASEIEQETRASTASSAALPGEDD